MSTILDPPEARARVEAYEAVTEKGALEKRAELIRGVIVKKNARVPASP